MDRAQLMDYLLEEAEERLRFLFKYQYDEGSPFNGAVPEPDRLCPLFPRNTSTRLLEMIALWLNPASCFYAHGEIPQRLMRALAFLKREQRPSGNIDLWDCNFDSAPDSGFFLWDLIPLYRLLENPKTGFTPELAAVASKLKDEVKALILSVLEGLCAGGFHTANHRWVMASSLVAGYRLTGNRAYMDRAQQYLDEGIDCNEDGEYSERSAIYNAVNNQAMIMLFEELEDKKYLSYVQRNLRMLVYYFEGDGSFFTGNSTRQDRGKKMYAGHYLYQYLYIAHYLKDEEAGKMAAYIASGFMKTRRQPGPDCYPSMMLHPELDFPQSADTTFSLPDYNRNFASSGIVRYKKGGFSFSLIHDNPAWLCLNSGSLSAYCRISMGYFTYGHVKINKLKTLENGYCFSFHALSWYFEPLEKPAGNLINYRAEDHSVRRRQHPNSSDLEVTVRFPDAEQGNGIDLVFTASGVNGVHYCFEFVLPAGLPVSGDHFVLLPKPGDYILLKDGGVTLRDNRSCLSIRGGFADTELFTQIPQRDCDIVYLKADEQLGLGDELSFDVLAPTKTQYDDLNDTSIVFRLNYGDISFLLMGDAVGESVSEMLYRHKGMLPATVLKAGHHGDPLSTTRELLQAVQPSFLVVSADPFEKHGEYTSELLELLLDFDITLYQTWLNGTVAFITDGSDIQVILIKS